MSKALIGYLIFCLLMFAFAIYLSVKGQKEVDLGKAAIVCVETGHCQLYHKLKQEVQK